MTQITSDSIFTLQRDANQQTNSAQGFSVAPMLDWTDRHCRVFHRHLTQYAWLYSEMVTTGAIIYGDNLPRFLGHDEFDQPSVLQLGGSGADDLAICAKKGEEWGYAEINLNVGCPSDRVQNNMIGACLMEHPGLVADGVKAMKDAVQSIPITVKSRIGIDDQEDFETLVDFVGQIQQSGADGVIVHARKAWLQGLSPKENREVPPLRYDWVRRLKQTFPDFDIAINGGIATPEDGLIFCQPEVDSETDETLPAVDGVMLGRAVYEKPFLLTSVDGLYYDGTSAQTNVAKSDMDDIVRRQQILQKMAPYIETHLSQGGKLNQVSRHMLGLFAGLPGGRLWRRYLSENAFKKGAGLEVMQQAETIVIDEIARMKEQQLEHQRYLAAQATNNSAE